MISIDLRLDIQMKIQMSIFISRVSSFSYLLVSWVVNYGEEHKRRKKVRGWCTNALLKIWKFNWKQRLSGCSVYVCSMRSSFYLCTLPTGVWVLPRGLFSTCIVIGNHGGGCMFMYCCYKEAKGTIPRTSVLVWFWSTKFKWFEISDAWTKKVSFGPPFWNFGCCAKAMNNGNKWKW